MISCPDGSTCSTTGQSSFQCNSSGPIGVVEATIGVTLSCPAGYHIANVGSPYVYFWVGEGPISGI